MAISPKESPKTKARGASKEDMKKMAGLVLRYAFMIALLVIFVGPFYWVFTLAIRGSGNIYDLQLIPDDPTFENIAYVWKQGGFARSFMNSVIVAISVVASQVILCSLAAYPLARLDFPGKKLIFLAILSTLMIPFQLYLVPLYLMMVKLQLLDTLFAVIIQMAVGAVGIYLIKTHYETIPFDLDEAARIDGATDFGIWWRIMLPLTKPAVAAMAIFIFVANWSSFLWPLIILNSDDKFTLPVAVSKLSGVFIDKTQYIMAGSVIAVAPVIILFFFLQRWFIGGLTVGSVKG